MPYMLKIVMTENCIIESKQNQTHTHKQKQDNTHKHINIMLIDMVDKPHFLSESDLNEMAV